jgi:integrase
MDDDHRPARRVRVEQGIYLQPNGKYAVCFMAGGRPRFRTVGYDIEEARAERTLFIESTRSGVPLATPELRFARVAGWWIERYERRVEAGERRERSPESNRYHLEKHLLPTFGPRLIRTLGVEDVATLMTELRAAGKSEKTIAGALATLQSIIRFALRNGWIAQNPVERLEAGERPHPVPRRQRVLGRDEIVRLLVACAPRYRTLVATAIYTGLRISELLGLQWSDFDLDEGELHVKAQLSRAHRGIPSKRVGLKTAAAHRDVPLTPQLVARLREHRRELPPVGEETWVFHTGAGTPFGHRNVETRALNSAAELAGLDDGAWPRLRFHDLRHTFASHLILDLRLDVAQVSRILGHAQVSTTLNVYTHLFDEVRHSHEVRRLLAGSAFAGLLTVDEDDDSVVVLPPSDPSGARGPSARERAAVRWGVATADPGTTRGT